MFRQNRLLCIKLMKIPDFSEYLLLVDAVNCTVYCFPYYVFDSLR